MLTDDIGSAGRDTAREHPPDATTVMFAGDNDPEGLLEGLLEWPEERPVGAGVVLAHPHPLHGATMNQPVVYRCAQACRGVGAATLRFNFRGVGRSRGSYSGRDEYLDVVAAASYLRSRMGAVSSTLPADALPLILIGYSFGSVMAASALSIVRPEAVVLIGLPVRSELLSEASAEGLRSFSGPLLAVCGEYDDIAPPAAVDATLRALGVDYRMHVLEGTGHFFEGRQREVGDSAASFVVATMREAAPASERTFFD